MEAVRNSAVGLKIRDKGFAAALKVDAIVRVPNQCDLQGIHGSRVAHDRSGLIHGAPGAVEVVEAGDDAALCKHV